jgi:RimJ/RimL family protein N-acetyltransferase
VRYAEEAITLAAMERGEVSAEIPILVLNELFVLDRPRLEDAKAARRFALDPDAARYFGWTIEQARAQPDSHYEDGIRQFAREWNDGTRFELTIRRRSDGEPVGSVELRPRAQSRSDADVSYMVAVELRGQSLAPMALEAMLAWGNRELGIRRAHIGCHVENTASRRVAEKCGFVLVGRVDDELRFRRDMGSSRS